MKQREYDVIIVGAGPAGAVTALELGKAGLSVAILDKADFPRDKTCGDALSVDVVNQLSILSEKLASSFETFPGKTSSYGVKIFSPGSQHVDIPFYHQGNKKCGYICKRFDFDNLLVQHLKEFSNVQMFVNCSVQKVEVLETCSLVHTIEGIFKAPIVVGADGAQSVVSKSLGMYKPDREHYSGGLRIYYEGVSSFHEDNFIELYFFPEILPGYLWIFPLPENKANVGIGMLSSEISKKKINLTKTLQGLLSNHPLLKERFAKAKPVESVKGYGLPLGSTKRKISGDRFLLVGDAASLIDPFTGEGIGNAIRSGRVAAAHVLECFKNDNFSTAFNTHYDEEIYARMWKELRISRTLQHLCRYPWLFNFVVKKANQSKTIHQFLEEALAQSDKKRSLAHPAFYYRLLFNKS